MAHVMDFFKEIKVGAKQKPREYDAVLTACSGSGPSRFSNTGRSVGVRRVEHN